MRDNEVTESDIENSWLHEYDQKIRGARPSDQVAMAYKFTDLFIGKTLKHRIVLTLENDIEETKIHIQHGRSRLGDMIAETLVQWTHSVFPIAEGQTVIAMFNSSAYRVEEPISKGPVTDLDIREIYPYKAEASLYQLKGKIIESLYFALRKDYVLRSRNENRYSPQINPGVREFEGRLQVRAGNYWTNIDKNEIYLIAFGPWLSQHRFGQSYRIEEWLKALKGRDPLTSNGFQEILVNFFPKILKANDQKTSQLKASSLQPALCGEGLFESNN